MKTILILMMFAMAACHPAPSNDDGAKVKGESFPESSGALSKWVRVNVGDFWAYEREQNPLSSFASAEGIVVGDTHMANFAPIPVRLMNGTREMRYLDIDFDDAGRAPFAYDFLRLVVTTKATKRDTKVKELVDAYVRGLTGATPVAAPADLQDDLALSSDEYEKRLSEDIDGKTSGGKFKMKPGKIERYKGALTIEKAAALLPGYTVLDLACRPVDDTNDDARIWIYAKDSAGTDRMFELKEYVATRLSAWAPQAPAANWLNDVRSALWPADVARGEYELVELSGMGTFWLREKKLTLIDIPYSDEGKKAVAYVRGLSNFDAYVLGQLHGRQSTSAPLAAQLSNPIQRAAFEDAVKEASKAYLTSIATRGH